jgi:hypothetical protein
MESKSKFFVCTYTNKCKDYCDKKFFENLGKIKRDIVHVVDNTPDEDYVIKLRRLAPWAHVSRLEVDPNPSISLFQRNVSDSVNYLRDKFLNSDKEYFLIIESDVIPPADLLSRLSEDIKSLDFIAASEFDLGGVCPHWGILGGLYYEGFHNYDFEGLHETHHVLSGCTVYKRELIEKYSFRYNEAELGPFPDAWICADAGNDFSFWNDHDIHCKHLHNTNGTRRS